MCRNQIQSRSGSLKGWVPVLSHVSLTALLVTNGDAELRISIRRRNSLTSADQGDAVAHCDRICLPRLAIAEVPATAHWRLLARAPLRPSRTTARPGWCSPAVEHPAGHCCPRPRSHPVQSSPRCQAGAPAPAAAAMHKRRWRGKQRTLRGIPVRAGSGLVTLVA